MKGNLYIYVLLALAALTGCRKQAVPDVVPVLPDEVPEMVVSVKADAQDPKFTFLFWHKDDFDGGLNQGLVTPFHVASPTGDINDYQENDYNTGKSYPENYGIAVCTGYAPYDGVTPLTDNSSFTDYTSLEVAEPGVTDVLVARNYLEGSAIFPFSGVLEFFHPQIQLTVYATTAATMTKYIKDVSFSIDKDNLLSSLEWNADAKGYRPTVKRPSSGWTSATLNEHINQSDKKPVGTVYVVPLPSEGWGMGSIALTISGMIGNAADGPYSPFTMTVPAAFKDDADKELTLELNDSYEIYLIFDEDQIEITAVKVPWEEGGNILVPIHPIPTESSGT